MEKNIFNDVCYPVNHPWPVHLWLLPGFLGLGLWQRGHTEPHVSFAALSTWNSYF